MATIDGTEAKKFAAYAKDSKTFFEAIVKKSNLKKSDNVVVLADGSGDFTNIIRKKVKSVVSIDLSREMIKLLSMRFKDTKNVKVLKRDVSNTKLPSNKFDKVFIIRAIHHIKNKKRVADEAFRLLTSGGKYIVADTFFEGNKLDELLFPLKWNLLYRKQLSWDEPCPMFPIESKFLHDLEMAGFSEITLKQNNVKTPKTSKRRERGSKFVSIAKKP